MLAFVWYKLTDVVFKLMSATGFVALMTTQVTCQEFRQCYNDVGICLWTDGSHLTQPAAQTACQRRNNSFLPRVTNSHIQSKLAEFRTTAWNSLGSSGFWIDVSATRVDRFHWIDGSPLAGWFTSTCNITVMSHVGVGANHAEVEI